MWKKTLTYVVLAFFALQSGLSLARDEVSKKVTTPIADTAITGKVKALYANSSLIKGANISVTTVNHTVFLSGKINTDEEYDKAVSLASSVSGVNDVNASKLRVTSSASPINDSYITAKVKGRLLKEKLFGDKEVEYWPVTVETKNGVVYLRGNVESQAHKNNIINAAKRVKGVKQVESHLAIQ